MKDSEMTTIYVCHGWAYDTTNWKRLVDLLRQQHIQLEIFKVPGLTQTSSDIFAIDDYVNWLDNQLKDKHKPIVLGHSNGGRIALNYCLKHPDKIGQLILINSAGNPPGTLQKIRNFMIKLGAKIIKPLLKIKFLQKLLFKIPKVASYMNNSDYRRAPDNMKQTLNNMLQSDELLIDRLTEIVVPTSLIWGQMDRVTPIEWAYTLNEQLSNVVSFEVIHSAGHVPYFSHPTELAKLIVKAVKEIK